MKEAQVIQESADELFEKLNVAGESEVSEKEDLFTVDVKTEEAGILIGYHGETLQAVQFILSLLVAKKLGKFVRLIVNVGDYREKREEKLKELALDAARRAKETKQEVVLGNLSAWQRRVIHMALSEDSEVMTESQGEEPDRQLVIKPK